MDHIELFSGTEGAHNLGKVAIVGESWGQEEASRKGPFLGTSGQELTRMLSDAGLNRHEAFLTNVSSRRPPDNDMRFFFNSTKAARDAGDIPIRGLYPDPDTKMDLARLHLQLAHVKPRVIIALGNYALWALTESNFSLKDEKGWKCPVGVGNWRGSYLFWNTWDAKGLDPELKTPVIPTYHPAAILRQWPWRTPAVHDLRTRVKPLAQGYSVPDPGYDFIIGPSFETCVGTLRKILEMPYGSLLSCDVECFGEQLSVVGIGWSDRHALVTPFVDPRRASGSYWTPDKEIVIVDLLCEILSGKRFRLTNQNINFDRQWWHAKLGVKAEIAFDTMTAQHVCWPGTPKALYYIASLYCRYYKFWKDDGRKWDITKPPEQLWHYNGIDCVTAWECSIVQEKLIKTLGFSSQFAERMEMLDIAFDMMLKGINIDKAERQRQSLYCINAQAEIANYLEQMLPEKFVSLVRGKTAKASWYDSPIQLAALIYDIFGVKEIIKRKTGNRTMDDDALDRIILDHPLLEPLLSPIKNKRSLGVIQSNMLSAALEPNGRMVCTFDPAGTETFRWSSYENAFWRGTNLQNIPNERDE